MFVFNIGFRLREYIIIKDAQTDIKYKINFYYTVNKYKIQSFKNKKHLSINQYRKIRSEQEDVVVRH